MMGRAQRLTLFALYQFAVFVGILLVPVALLTRRAGFTLPVRSLMETLDRAYENATR